jgi:hypothetical protein
MKRLIALIALLPLLAMGRGQNVMTGARRHMFAASASENPAYVSSSFVYYATTGGSTGTNSWPITVTCSGGETVILALTHNRSGYSSISWSATNGNTIALGGDYINYTNNVIADAHISSCVAGSTTITVTVSGTYGSGQLMAARFTGLVSQTLDAAGTLNTGSSTTPSCAVSAAASRELIIVNGYDSGGSGFIDSPSGFVQQYHSGYGYWVLNYNLTGSAGTNTFTETTGTGSWTCVALAYK